MPDPEAHIATLNEDAHLVMTLTVDKGRGYVSADKNKYQNMPIGVIPIDSIFTPIKKVNYTVTDTRVGQITDYDKLTLEVWTDGSVQPDEAISTAAKILTEHLSLFVGLTDKVAAVTFADQEDDKKGQALDMTIEELDLSVRAYNCLHTDKICLCVAYQIFTGRYFCHSLVFSTIIRLNQRVAIIQINKSSTNTQLPGTPICIKV